MYGVKKGNIFRNFVIISPDNVEHSINILKSKFAFKIKMLCFAFTHASLYSIADYTNNLYGSSYMDYTYSSKYVLS